VCGEPRGLQAVVVVIEREKTESGTLVCCVAVYDPAFKVVFSQTCKTLSIASLERIVWTHALCLVWIHHGIFVATFPGAI
jgi:hypothetical protein